MKVVITYRDGRTRVIPNATGVTGHGRYVVIGSPTEWLALHFEHGAIEVVQ